MSEQVGTQQVTPGTLPIVLVQAPAPTPTRTIGVGTGVKIILVIILLAGLGVLAWWLLSTMGGYKYDCSGIAHVPTEVCWPNTEEKVPASKNCCRCRLIVSLNPLNPYSSPYECGHYWG